ncbi:DNA-binding transcriptional regulator, CsgD family [Xaviernesmea oryzae]|nr:DNA-binding transcriptional regulator, CsgD family [Xaviernesmea oryzae]
MTAQGDFADLLLAVKDPSVTSEYEILRVMRRVATEFGFLHFMVARLPFGEDYRFAERLVLSNWPADLVRRYDRAGVFATSRLVDMLRLTKLPVFGVSQTLLDFPVEEVGEENANAALPLSTYGTMFVSVDGESFVVTLSGNRQDPDAQEAAWLHFILLHLFERLCRSMESGMAPREKLSAREIECLRWAAAGKSSDEIAVILGISAYTVSSYFKTATKKLDAVNRMQAIARAMRLKLI